MQAESVKNFTSRLNALQSRWSCSDIDFAKRIGISRQLLYLMRNGTQPPSKKTVRLLEQAEQAAGIFQSLEEGPENSPTIGKTARKSSNDWKAQPSGMRESRVWDGGVTPEKMLDAVERIEMRTRDLNRDVEDLRAMVEQLKHEQEEGIEE